MKKFTKVLALVLSSAMILGGTAPAVFADEEPNIIPEGAVLINETNFPDENFRNAILNMGEDFWNNDDYDDGDYDDGDYDDGDDDGDDGGDDGDYGDDSANLVKDDQKAFYMDEQGNKYVIPTLITELCLYGETKNLKGIELFTNLDDIYVSYFTGKTVDLSKNKKLTKVSIFANKAKTFKLGDYSKIKSLYITCFAEVDVSKLKNAEILSINAEGTKKADVSKLNKLSLFSIYSSNLTSVNLGSSAKLTYVYIGGKFKSVDVKKLKNLEHLSVESDAITKVDVSKNTKLKYLSLTGKKISSVDVKNLKKLDDLCLKKTAITKVDVSKNAKLTYFSVAESAKLKSVDLKKNTKLSYIDVTNTTLSKLDVSKNTNLTTLRVYNSKITSLNLSKNKKLSSLEYDLDVQKTVKLANTKDLRLSIFKIGNKKTVDLSKVIGTGYKMTVLYGDEKVKYDKKTGKITLPKKFDYSYIELTKGSKKIRVSLSKNKA